MTPGSFRFGDHVLDPVDRSLARGGKSVDVSARYLDALILLVADAGRLVTKDRFMQEVWRGVPVTDEALTQCVRTLRRLLDDDAARPRYIETVPKHGYRFVAAVERTPAATPQPGPPALLVMDMPANGTPIGDDLARWQGTLLAAGAGTLGASLAGLAGGLIYGFALASQTSSGDPGGGSVLFVVLWLTIVVATIGGAGVSAGIVIAGREKAGWWRLVGGAVGGMVVGGVVKLLGLDAFHILLGRSPGNVTGALEGLALGASVGFGAWLAERDRLRRSLRAQLLAAGAAGALGGLSITVAGGRLLGGSLQLLSHSFSGSMLQLDALGALFGEVGFDRITQAITAMGEGALFAIGIVGAMQLSARARRAS